MSLSPPAAVVYPNAVTTQPTSHSKGSFGPVFAVLAVVIVLSAIACFIGQLCARRFSHPKQPKRDSHPKQPRRDRNFHHEEGDIEFGFKNGMPTGKPAGNGETRGPKPAGNGGNKGETKFAEEPKEASER
ncbi:hypothetical protein BVC80_9043g43 [Macleaya cordata]|uniref:Transmembrane protein n=1 Tax=Macleaya cordata TaxID=56857 RepID=A0A200R2P1_MACCD|nr:hypothetical protein BVC80_9043g43 [Macleaya cordata]